MDDILNEDGLADNETELNPEIVEQGDEEQQVVEEGDTLVEPEPLPLVIRATFNEDGFPTAFYPSDFWSQGYPEAAVEITAEQYQELLSNQGRRLWIDGEVVEYVPPPVITPDPVTIVNSVDLWSRMTDSEADQVGAAMEQQSFRVRKIFESASTFRSDHELWPLLDQIATTLFGAERAAEILAPSV